MQLVVSFLCNTVNVKSLLSGHFGNVYRARLTGWDDGSVDGIVAVKTLKGYISA